MLTLKKVKEMVKAPVHTKRVPSPKVLLEDGRILLRKEFEHGSHLTLYHNGYVWFSAGKRNTVFHIHDCRGDYAYGASKGKGEVIKEEYFENCEWHILFCVFSLLFLRWSIRHDILMIEIQRLRNLIPRLWKISIGRKSMSVSYKKLWKLLIDRDMKKKDLCVAAGISHTSMAKLGKNENVTTDVLVKICTALQCDISDIMELTVKSDN